MSALETFRDELHELSKKIVTGMKPGNTIAVFGETVHRHYDTFYISGFDGAVTDLRQFKPERGMESHLLELAKRIGNPTEALEELRKIVV